MLGERVKDHGQCRGQYSLGVRMLGWPLKEKWASARDAGPGLMWKGDDGHLRLC